MTITTPNASNSPVISMEDGNPQVDSPVTERNAQTNADSSPIVVTEDNPPVSTDSPVVDENPPAVDTAPKQYATPEWAQRRIDKVVAQRHEAEEAARRLQAQNEELLRELAEARNGGNSKPTTTPESRQELTEKQIEELALKKAAELAEIARFNENCNRVADAGKKEFKDWDSALSNLRLAGVLGEGSAVDFLETAIELDQPHKVLHHLGTNPEEAERIAKLPPKKMALELGRIETMLKNPAAPTVPVSRAPDPVIPVGGKSSPAAPTLTDPDISSEEWFNLRQQQIEERRNRYRR